MSINIDIKTQEVSFALPDFGLGYKDTYISPEVWESCSDALLRSEEAWGIVELGYLFPGDDKKPGRIQMLGFKDFCPYTIDLDEFKDARSMFTLDEWIDIVLAAVDYNPKGYDSMTQKLSVLQRLLPFVEKNLNLIELAPLGTGNEGKSDEELAEGLLFALRCGANLIDVMGDLYCKDPRELTCNPAAVEKQKRLIDEIHERGGEVLISSHLFRYAPAEEVLEIALAQQERGADIVKIVCAADSEEQELEALRIITLLRQALRVPFLFLVGGSHCRLVRHIGPMLGCCMWLTVPAHDALSTKVQPVCRAIRAIADNFDYAPDRTFDDE